MLLFCVRHGESVYNAQGRIQGHSDVPLSDLGRRQAGAVSEALRREAIEVIYSSPLRRALETAEPIARALKIPLRIEPRLIEIDVGVFQDRTAEELRVEKPEALARWRSGDPDYSIPGGESRRAVARRGEEAFRAIHQSGFGRVLITAHGGVIVATVKSLLGIPLEDPPYALENASITRLEWDESRQRPRLQAFNQTDHLQGIGRGTAGDLAV